MIGDRSFETRLIFMVERAGRLVEKPDRCRCGDQTGERDPSALARGKPAAGPVGNLVEGEGCAAQLRGPAAAGAARPPERCPERQGLAWRKAGFYAILMTDKVQLRAIGGDYGLDWRSAPEKTAAGRRDQCGEDRNRLVLPLPLAPVSSRAPPAGKRNESPAKTRRSPRRQARSSATRSGRVRSTAHRREKKRLRWGKTGAARPRSNCSTEYEVWGTNL